MHHELVVTTPIHQNPSELGRMEVIGFTFWSFERGAFRVADYIRVEHSDTSLVERTAKKYMRKGFSLYDHLQHSVSPAICFRAGTADGYNAIYMFSTEEEKNLSLNANSWEPWLYFLRYRKRRKGRSKEDSLSNLTILRSGTLS